MNRVFGIRVWSGLLAAVIALTAWLGVGSDAATPGAPPANSLVAADPEPNALLAVVPDHIALTFAEPVDPESANIRLLRAGGADVPLGSPQVDPAVPTRLSAPLPRLPLLLNSGDYTVAWTARAADDGALFAGAYPFRTGIVGNPGAAERDGEWPAPWATLLRWVVFLGTALAGGGFAWGRLLARQPSVRAPGSAVRLGAMAVAALLALLATAIAPLLARFFIQNGDTSIPLEAPRGMPLGWWLQLAALVMLALLGLGTLASRRTTASLPAALDWAGVGAGMAALVGLSLTSHAASPWRATSLVLEIAHQWSTALWLSGLLFFIAGWRGLGTDVARFRTVRWIGGALIAVSVVTGLARAWPLFPAPGHLVASRYGQVLVGKTVIVLVIVALGSVAMLVPRTSNAVRASRSLGAQGFFAVLAVFLAALLALVPTPGTVAPASLAGVALADVVPLDRAAFAVASGTIHLLTQPAAPGAQTLVVRLTDAAGMPLVSNQTPAVQMTWTSLLGSDALAESVILQPDSTGTLFTGAVTLPAPGWWQADAIVTPPGGIASRARFWLVLPDPNVTGGGPIPTTDPAAAALFERGLESLTALRSVRYAQRLADGGGSLSRTRASVSAAEGERPAAYAEVVIDAEGNVVAQQTIVGDRRWIRDGGDWAVAEPIPFFTPAAWGEAYEAATGFQLGPRENVDGELSQVVTFWQPPRDNPPRAPAWYAWWIGLASGEVRREAMVSTRHYMVNEYSDFNAPFEITAPIDDLAPGSTPTQPDGTPVATPVGREQSAIP